MDGYTELRAAVEALPVEEKRELALFLLSRLRDEGLDTSDSPSLGHSVLDVRPVSLGCVLRPLDSNDDLLGEMLEGQ